MDFVNPWYTVSIDNLSHFSIETHRTMPKEKIINIRVEADLKKQAKKLAENDGRSLSNWILKLIRNEIAQAKSAAKK